MDIITRTSKLSSEQQAIFAQGASYLISANTNEIGVWTENTPKYKGDPIVTIGACSLNGSEAINFLRNCVSLIKEKHPERKIVGPMNGNTWMKHRLIIETSDRKPFRMEPIEPNQLLETFEAAGFQVLSRYSSSSIDLKKEQRNFQKVAKLVERKGIVIRPIDIDNFKQELEAIFELSISAFASNFLYTPLPREIFIQAYLKAKALVDPELVQLAFRNDRLIGFVFCMPDENPQTVIVKTLATCPSERTAGLGTLLVAMVQQIAKDNGYHEAIHALQYESNSSLRISQRFYAEKFRTYGLMSI